MPFRVEQNSFFAGEIAAELDARRDTQQYRSSLARARNITAIPQGGFQRREGTKYVATLTDQGSIAPTAGVRVIPFQFSKTETYLIILTTQKLEVRNSSGTVVTTFTDLHPYGLLYQAADVADVAYTQALDTMFLAHPDYKMLVLQRFDSTDWRLTEFIWTKQDDESEDEPGVNQPYHKFASGDVTMALSANTAPTAAVTATASEGAFKGTQLATRMRLFNRAGDGYIESEIATLPNVTLTGTTVDISDGVLPDAFDIFVGCSTADAAYESEVYVGDLVYLTADAQTIGGGGALTRVPAVVATITDDDNMVLTEIYQGTVDTGTGTLSMVQSGTAVSLTANISISGTAVTGAAGSLFLTEVNIGDRIFIDTDGQKKATKVLSIASNTALTLDRAYVGAAGPAAGSVVTKQGTTTAVVNNRIKVGTVSGTAKTSWKEAAISPRRGYPRTVALHQNRLVVGGTRDLPDTCYFSKSGLYFVYDEGSALADESFALAMTSDEINDIQALASRPDLMIGTLSETFFEQSVPITPDDAGVQAGPNIGWAKITPVSLEGAVVYVSDGRGDIRQRVVELLFNDGAQTYEATDISLLAFHLINTPVRMAMRQGDSQTTADNVFIICSGTNADEDIDTAGSLAVLNTIRSQQVTGWMLWTTDGNFLDAATIGNVVWFAVQRSIDGSDVVYLEQLDATRVTDSGTESDRGTALTNSANITFTIDSTAVTCSGDFTADSLAADDWIMLDSAGVVHRAQIASVTDATNLVLKEGYSGATATGVGTKLAITITGLSHLEAETVDVYADSEYLGPYTVASGSITPERPVNAAEVGLPYAWSAVTLAPNSDTQAGASTNVMRRVVHLDVSLLRAKELRVRHYGDTGAGQRVDFSQAGVTLFGSEPDAFTGTKRIHMLGLNRHGQVELFGSEPRPTHVRGLTLEVA